MVYCSLIFMIWYAISLLAEPAVPYKAMVIVPVADTVWVPLGKYGKEKTPLQYKRLPFSPEKPMLSCARFHQLKKNELVTVIAVAGDEVQCESDALYYCKKKFGMKLNSFWMLKKNLIPLEDLKKKGISVPPSIDRACPPSVYNSSVLTLTTPWYDPITQQLYSVGTRFVRCKIRDKKSSYAVFTLTADLQEKVTCVPKSAARVVYAQKYEKARDQFLKLLHSWAAIQNHMGESDSKKSTEAIIPYVLGGCSFRDRSPDKGFQLISGLQCGKKSLFWQRTGDYEEPRDGFDCSSIILCAAQIVGMPYYCKNTFALFGSLSELKPYEKLEVGDLVWYLGHVLVVSDLEKNLLIEAVGYDKGYGKIHEIVIDRVFEGIKDFSGLEKAFHEKKAVRRLTSKGKRMPSLYTVQLFRLRTIWR